MKRGKSPQPDGDDEGGAARRRELIRWAGLSTEVVASVGVSVWLGVKADKWLKLSFPILSWALPLLVIVVLLINLVKAGTNKKNGK
ncbi:hypothetical protein [Puia dinghuensis]|uniref:AtpZ/AtpI family protein n=1 Tax=Puia dinghuensis TaxID=1792502 RepID=A0A8J2UAX1_9BACT|nr:hypothetical protein [Puia dinghuensis]GGA91412.1 hypothetical protein GCM10011511_13450 [Puia dinghuensis]